MSSNIRYAIFLKRYADLGTDDPRKDYLAVPIDRLSNGIFVPRSHYEIDPDVLAEVDADSPEEAVTAYREKLEDSFL